MEDIPTANVLKRYQHWLFVVLSAILLFLSFPNANLFPLAWGAIVPLFIALNRATSWKAAFCRGYLTGFLFFAGLLVAIVFLYPYANIYQTLLGYLLLVGYTALYFGVFAACVQLLPWRSGIVFPVAAACIWTALEWVRSWMLTGFPWGSIGYSQWNNLPGIQIVSVVGVHGVSFVIVLFNAGIATVLRARRRWGQKIAAMGVPLIVLLICFGYGVFQLQSIENSVVATKSRPGTSPASGVKTVSPKILNIGLVPGNIPQLRKWKLTEFPAIFRRYIGLTRKASQASPDVIIWPETTVRGEVLSNQWPTYHRRFKRMLRETGIPMLIGATAYEKLDAMGNKVDKVYNRAFSVSPEGKILGKYAKMRLVPFGEYVPLASFLPNFIQFKPFEPGKSVNLLPLFNVKNTSMEKIEVGVSICFESGFPDHFRRFVKKGAKGMGILTNDAWFEGTAFPALHLSMAPFRAIENRIAVFRCANGGFSGVFDRFGRATTPLITPYTAQEILVAAVPLREGEQTFYTRYGDWFPILCALLCLGWLGWRIVVRFRQACLTVLS